MRYKIVGLLAAVLISGNAAADPLRSRPQPERQRTWVLDTAGLFLEQARKPRLAIKLPDWTWAGEPYACAPDIAIGPRGEGVVTSNVLPVLWKIEPETLAVSVHRLHLDADADKDVGFSALVYSERHSAYFAVSELTGSLWRIDPLLRRAHKIALSQPVYGACAVSMQRQERTSRFTKLCLHGKYESLLVNLAPDQRSAYVQTAGCSPDAFALNGGAR
jgi:hypothetical protein